MRPETFHNKVNLAIKRWLLNNDNSGLIKLIPEMKKRWMKMAKDQNDYRKGEQTYGYNSDSIHGQMEYISDRWSCAFRLKWIIDGLENGSI